MNLFQYAKKYGSYSFSEVPFNEVDNIVFTQIPYLPLNEIVGGFGEEPFTIELLVIRMSSFYFRKGLKGTFYKSVFILMKQFATSKRYQSLLVYNYVKEVDHNKQFGAITIKLPDNSIYVSYEGTDTAISGWKEDACMTYQFPIPAQELALRYLKRTISIHDKSIMLGGHSKGGNLAVYAAMESPSYLQRKIKVVYNNDGPGFLKEIVESKKYQKIKSKIYKIVPHESVVGMLLYYDGYMKSIKSKRKSLLQHDPFHWQISETSFTEDNLSNYSIRVHEKVKGWVEDLRVHERERCVEDLFDTLAFSDVLETYDFFSIGKSISTIREIRHLEESSKKNLWDAVKIIV